LLLLLFPNIMQRDITASWHDRRMHACEVHAHTSVMLLRRAANIHVSGLLAKLLFN
jgi:hypothetical protein